jgi:hypothetical protein
MLTVSCVLAFGALIASIVAAMGRCPLWVPVILLSIVALLQCIPVR